MRLEQHGVVVKKREWKARAKGAEANATMWYSRSVQNEVVANLAMRVGLAECDRLRVERDLAVDEIRDECDARMREVSEGNMSLGVRLDAALAELARLNVPNGACATCRGRNVVENHETMAGERGKWLRCPTCTTKAERDADRPRG